MNSHAVVYGFVDELLKLSDAKKERRMPWGSFAAAGAVSAAGSALGLLWGRSLMAAEAKKLESEYKKQIQRVLAGKGAHGNVVDRLVQRHAKKLEDHYASKIERIRRMPLMAKIRWLMGKKVKP